MAPEDKKPKGKPPAKAAKKEKPPAVEDKPFAEFVEQHYIPALKEALGKQGLDDLELSFAKQKVAASLGENGDCAQVIGRWMNGRRQFNIYFPAEDIKGPRAFSCFEGSSQPSTLEPFLIDERKIDLDLLVFYVVQRLNGQKWLGPN